MPLIEQAIFAPDETHRTTAYRIMARSDGVIEADASELATWCPTHDAMLHPRVKSLNFHSLPSGAYCVSQTTATGWDCRSHGGERCLTHCLLVPPELLARFANNPFALIRSFGENQFFDTLAPSESKLPSIPLVGGAAAVDPVLLSELAKTLGPGNMAAMVHLALSSLSLALAGAQSPAELIDGLLNCLPPPCRLEFSFSTGLKFSPRRPFRFVTISDDPAEQSWIANHPNVTVFHLGDKDPIHNMVINDWARLIARVLSTDQTSFLATQLSKRRFDLTLDDLPALGLQLLEELDSCEIGGGVRQMADEDTSDAAPQRAHAAHRRFEKSVEAVMATKLLHAAPSACLHPTSPELLEQLECLDDLVYDAINGQSLAMRQLREVWPKILAELGDELLAESREQYLRYAMSIWDESNDAKGVRDPMRAVQVLDVLCLLFGDASSV